MPNSNQPKSLRPVGFGLVTFSVKEKRPQSTVKTTLSIGEVIKQGVFNNGSEESRQPMVKIDGVIKQGVLMVKIGDVIKRGVFKSGSAEGCQPMVKIRDVIKRGVFQVGSNVENQQSIGVRRVYFNNPYATTEKDQKKWVSGTTAASAPKP